MFIGNMLQKRAKRIVNQVYYLNQQMYFCQLHALKCVDFIFTAQGMYKVCNLLSNCIKRFDIRSVN